MQQRIAFKLIIIFLSLLFAVSVSTRPAFTSSQDNQQLAQQAWAILATHCLACHGEDKMSGLDLRTREAAFKGGSRGAALIAGRSDLSLMLRFINGEFEKRMPLGGSLSAEEIAVLTKWIDAGALWPEPSKTEAAKSPLAVAFKKEKEITDEQRNSWAFRKPVRPNVPKVKNAAWVRNPVDAFILARLEEKGLAPAPPADKRTLLRRVTFDLTGLPPTPEEIKAFLNDNSADAYEKVVKRLLASPRYGERWAQHWLDVVRFAETNGYELDAEREQAWRYRDYVVKAFNEDKPYDRFILEQLAGDELDPTNFEAHVATGFLRAGPQHVVAGNQDEALNRQEYLTEAMFSTSAAFLGLTVGCARCHDHKFDPILQSDFYRLQAFFAATDNTDFTNHSKSDEEAFAAAKKAHKAKLKPIEDQLREIEKPYEDRIQAEKRRTLEPRYARALDIPKDKRTKEQQTDFEHAERMLEVKYEELLVVMPADVRQRRAALRRQMHGLQFEAPAPLPKALSVADKIDPIPRMFVLKLGDVHSPIREVEPRFLTVMLPKDAAPVADISPAVFTDASGANKQSAGRRLTLARWFASPDHPLTARVMMNRLWHHYFRRGIVATPNDFGRNGAGATHPELLDWLAVEFMQSDLRPQTSDLSNAATRRRGDTATTRNGQRTTDNGQTITQNSELRTQNSAAWRLKRMHELIVTSNAYRQASDVDPEKNSQAVKTDPDNKLFWRQNRLRLDAEAIRDAMLLVNGTLTEQLGGAPIRVPLDPEVYETIFTEYEPDNLWPVTPDVKQHTRRSLYLFRKRNVKLPMLVAYDQPDLMSSCGARAVSIHSLQALTLMNSDVIWQQAQALATRLFNEAGASERARIERMYELALGRPPRAEEIKATQMFLKQQTIILRERKGKNEAIVELKGVAKKVDAITAAAWVDLCLATLNLNEFVYVK